MKNCYSKKIWIMNFEEAYGQQSWSKLYKDYCRYLLCVQAQDIYITGTTLPEDFVEYVSNLKGVSSIEKWIIDLSKNNISDSFCNYLLNNPHITDSLIKLSKNQKFCLKPFYESRSIHQIASIMEIPVEGTNEALVKDGLVERFNNKSYFKIISKKLNIDTVPCFIIQNKQQVIDAINSICKIETDKVFLKKSSLNGEQSNLSGGRQFLIKKLDQWLCSYIDEIIAEKFIDIVEVCGSLISIDNNGCDFLGINTQIIDNCVWQGCHIPFKNNQYSDEIRRKSLKYAELLYKLGGRGSLNIDWAIALDENSLKLFALESNFRYNGFEFVLDIVKSCFKTDLKNSYIVYYNSFPLSKEIDSYTSLINKTKKITVDNKPLIIENCNCCQGAVFTSSPIDNKTGLLITGNSPSYLRRAKEALSKAVGF